jgi:hypothetical protein
MSLFQGAATAPRMPPGVGAKIKVSFGMIVAYIKL